MKKIIAVSIMMATLFTLNLSFADDHKKKSDEKYNDKAIDKYVTIYTYQALAMDEGCWATFYDKKNFKGANLTLAGRYSLGDIDFDLKPYSFGGYPDSVKVGEKATLHLYGDENYKDLDYTLKANASVKKLKMIPVWDKIESVRLTCNK
ncbi:hypothetical protein MRY82_05195 [bacterium]|nr:hypothetical protein [bacterium]